EVPLNIWEENGAALKVYLLDDPLTFVDVPAFPLPFSKPVENFQAPLRQIDSTDFPEGDFVALDRVELAEVPLQFFRSLATSFFDPENEFDSLVQTLPFGPRFTEVLTPAMNVGAKGFIGILDGFPWLTKEYYVPYDGIVRDIPAVWVDKEAGSKIAELMSQGEVVASISVEGRNYFGSSQNIVATLKGKEDKWVIIGSHHDAPWASAVEDGTGIAMVLAQAKFWSKVSERKYNMMFLLTAGHMSGGAGTRKFIETHHELLEDTVIEIHLEHAANECKGVNGHLVVTGEPECRWWFTSEIEELQSSVVRAIAAENLKRSLVLKPDIFMEHPPTDGGFFHLAGVPILDFLTAPMYLFDKQDTLDKVDVESLVPISRAVIRVIEDL
ncbi:MAG: M28 family peptidase, partial [Acidimicrobiales bacterium]|nr:M28 family peptidase [Acidimicrobiales bacterium]